MVFFFYENLFIWVFIFGFRDVRGSLIVCFSRENNFEYMIVRVFLVRVLLLIFLNCLGFIGLFFMDDIIIENYFDI